MNNFNVGDFVSLSGWSGVIADILKSESDTVYRIRFVKNIIKGQADEWHSAQVLASLQTASAETLSNEFNRMIVDRAAKFAEMLKPF